MSLLKNKNTRTAVLLFATAAMSIIGCKKDPVVTPTPPTPPTPPTTKTEVVLKINDFLPLSAKQEEEVVINGDGFTKSIDSVTVQFSDGPAIKPKSTNGTQMIVIVPSSAKDGPLTVAVLNKTPVKSAQGFTYVPTTTNPGTNPGGNPGTNPGGNPGGTNYVVKTATISGVSITTQLVNGKLTPVITKYSNGSGTVIDLRTPGTDLNVTWANANDYKIEMSGNTPMIAFNNAPSKVVANAADSLSSPTVKITGFKNEAYNQLNLILVKDNTEQAGKISFLSQPAQSILTNDNVKSVLNGTMKKQSITLNY